MKSNSRSTSGWKLKECNIKERAVPAGNAAVAPLSLSAAGRGETSFIVPGSWVPQTSDVSFAMERSNSRTTSEMYCSGAVCLRPCNQYVK